MIERVEYALKSWKKQKGAPWAEFENTYAGELIQELVAELKAARTNAEKWEAAFKALAAK